MTTNTLNETLILFHSGSGKLAQLLSPHLTSRNFKTVTTLREVETLIFPTIESHIVVIDWDSWDDGEDILTRLRSRHYVIPIIVVGTEISHSQTLDLLRLQVNDVILSLEPNSIIQSLNRIFSEFAVISLSNIFMYSTRRYKALSHMNSAMDALLDAIKSLRLRNKDTEFQSAIKQLPPQTLELPKQIILIVDDIPAITIAFAKKFQNQYVILTANSSNEALGIAKAKKNIDLIILDIEMPGRKGNEIIGELREICPKAGIIIQTAYKAHDVAVESFQNGVLDYINKSSNPRKVAEVIHSALMMKRQWEASHLLPLRLRQELFVQYLKIAIEGGYPILWEDLHVFFPDIQLENVILSEPLSVDWLIDHPIASMK